MTNKLKSIDLFAGIGGIRLGFEKAFGPELKTSFVSEWDQHAQKTYRANFSDDFEIACRRIRSWNNIPCSAEQVTIF